MSKYLMAIDAGTGSVRAVIFDLDGNQICSSQREWYHKEDPKYPGSMDFDVVTNWNLTIECIKNVLKDSNVNPDDISAISTTSMREGIVLYDEEDNEIWACANVDSRSDIEVSDLKEIDENLEKEIYNISGQTFSLGALPRLLWVKKHMPDIYNKTKTLTMFNDWLIYKLSGVLSCEPSNGCTTGIFDLNKRTWNTEIAKKCGLREDIFPTTYESGSVVSNVSEKCSKETNLSTSTLVVSGGGDAQLGCVGLGLVSDEQIAILGGSFWQLECNTLSPTPDDDCRIRINCHAVPDMFQYEAIAFFPGLVMRWYRDAFCHFEKELSIETGIDPYDYMNEKAKDIPPGCYGLVSTFSDVMNYISWRHASPTFTNFELDPNKFNKYTFYRSILENAALVTRGHLEMVRDITSNKQTEIIFANGASKSDLWCQIMADVLNVTISVPKVKEATALGAAMCAGVGANIYTDLLDASKIVKWDKKYYPNNENVVIYNGVYKRFREVYNEQLKIADKGLTKHMWKAPGI